MNLKELVEKRGNGTDKKTHGYLDHYEKYFKILREDKINLLEIGIGQAGSLRLWRDYFKNGEIYGVDTRQKRLITEDRITTHHVSQEQRFHWHRFFAKHDVSFDIIIDDGSHIIEHQQLTFGYLFEKVKSGGYYIIEDLHTSFMGDEYGMMSHDTSTYNVLKNYMANGQFYSRFLPQEEIAYIQNNASFCEVIEITKRSITSIIKKL